MSAYIIVLETPFFTRPDESGRFILSNIPPGTYTLKIWHERLKAADHSVFIQVGKTTMVEKVLE